MKIGYARVSTKEQDTSLQIEALVAAGCEKIFEENMSGAKDDRPELKKALAWCRGGDTLVVCKLDRLGRSTGHLINTVKELRERGVEFVSLKDSIDTGTTSGKLMFGMLCVIAEFERDLISDRVSAGIARARERKVAFGRTRHWESYPEIVRLREEGGLSCRRIAALTGKSAATVSRVLKIRKDAA